jgi:RNA polymerase sigma-70 factor (ECF subfamily)
MIALSQTAARRRAWDDPDAQLMIRVRSGDLSAFDELTRRYQRVVAWHIERSMGNERHSEDLTQEVFLRAFRARERYVATAKFSTWLLTISHNVVSNARRWLARHGELTLHTQVQSSQHTRASRLQDAASDQPWQRLLKTEEQTLLHRAVNQLGERQRMAIRLFYFDGMSYAGVAEAMGTSQKAVKALLHRAREQVRGMLAPYEMHGCEH